ncbi:hypothetical protein LTR36_003923 [Oleoguttula mirabilis]|uniref:Uncharacterized protein n=1 Tax=Oleoguttula mirabilis TaxID=1507867 RepID=A0AAV9JHG3_9PEZI|nr:hypothetical protein LTR36_003923 [Oleoguttula mirabilis]
MLSRSNSTAGERLRRAKSTSSQHTTSSGHQRTTTSLDPFVTRQHAEAAAVEAYNRARPSDEPANPAYRPVPPKIQRRRSQTTGRTEGSYLEDARLGRRRSTSTKGDGRAVQAARSKPPTVSDTATVSTVEEKVVTRKRSMIPPSTSHGQSQPEYLSVPPAGHRPRKTQLVYADGSPTPRHVSTLQERTSTLQLSSTPVREHIDGYGGNLATLSDFGGHQDDNIGSFTSPRRSIRETQTDEDILAIARDRCLQDFQQKKLRERKSIFLAPFQKRRATYVQQSSDSSYDNCLPPFNYADDITLAALPPAPEPVPTSQIPVIKVETKSRNFSDTIKGRIKKAFRKAFRAPTSMPAQHVEAKHFHYSASEDAYHSLSEKQADPFTTFTNDKPAVPSQLKSGSANSRESVGQISENRSRVTSWTNSTVAGTCASRAENHMLVVSEQGQLRRSGSQVTLRKASSFFGRPVMQKLRKPSKAQLSSSEESHGLFSALQDRMRPSQRTYTPPQLEREEAAQRSSAPSALSTLPSQQRGDATTSSTKRYSTPTVRSVTPDPLAYKLGICSPVPEVLSPDGAAPAAVEFDGEVLESAETTPRADLERRPASKAPAPSQEQLARRMEKSRNRWQSPLDELSPAGPRSTRATMMEDNPYELRSLSQSHPQPPVSNDLPHHAKVGYLDPVNRADMLSPSLYSRATDGASPRPDTPVEPMGTVVTITGREVRSYSISPPKKAEQEPPKPAQTSGQWRRWLSDEMGSFKAGLESVTLTQAMMDKDQHISASLARPDGVSQGTAAPSNNARPSSASPPLGARPVSASTSTRPRATSRRSSFMNERFPMIDSSRNSSERSIRSHTASRTGERTATGSEQSSQGAAVRPNVESQSQRTSLMRQRVVTGRQSIAHLESTARSRSAWGSSSAAPEPTMSGALPADPRAPAAAAAAATHQASLSSDRRAKASNRHKSAYELRANYTNSNTGRSTPLEIRRRPIMVMNDATNNNLNILDDTTILDISAGPYGGSQQQLPATGSAPASSAYGDRKNKENTPPSSEASGLPALSSSEWLSAGANKTRKPSAVHPAYRNRSVSRYSPIKAGQFVGKKEGQESPASASAASPGQRLAGEWLEKRSRDSTPAFV